MVKQSLGNAALVNGQSAQHVMPKNSPPAASSSFGLADSDSQPLRLDDSARALVRQKAMWGLVRVLVAQALMVLFAVVVSWAVAGVMAGASALLGAGAYFVPNALFAVRLLLSHSGVRPVAATGFLTGELIKVASSVLLLVVVVYVTQEWLVWPAMLFGLVCVLKGYVLLLLFHKLP